MRTAAVLVALAMVTPAAAAPGPSRRYPPEPVDADQAAEEYSDFWERALAPDRGAYDKLVARARELVNLAGSSGALEVLAGAIELLPDAPDAYFLRGWAHELAGDWGACADDYAAAAERDPAFAPSSNVRPRGPLADGLGTCLARAGKFAEAAAALAQYTATGEGTAAVWMRLGEAYMALGRLDDAIAALDRGADKARAADYAQVRWLRAAAYDRARRPTEAAAEAAAALHGDPSRSRITTAGIPTAPAEDVLYLTGIAYEARADGLVAMPERALLYFREFLEHAPTSLWRKRAEEHVAALRQVDPTEPLSRHGAKQGTTTFTAAAIGKLLRKDIAGLSACLADLPGTAAELRVVLHGPPARPARGTVVVSRPTAGASARVAAQVGAVAATADVPGALRCLEQAAGKLRLPKLERGTWVQLVFPVIAR